MWARRQAAGCRLGGSPVVRHVISMCRALGSIPSTAQNKKRGGGWIGGSVVETTYWALGEWSLQLQETGPSADTSTSAHILTQRHT